MHYWAIVRYEDIRRISRDPATFCSGRGVQFADAPPEMLEASQSFLAMDAPRHTKLRALVSAAFTPRQVARIEDGIRVNAKQIVEEAAATGGGDFVELIAKRLPLQTISDMLGVPDADRERVVQAADTLVSAADPEVFGDRQPLEVLGSALWTLTEFATELAKHREQHPGDDLMTGAGPGRGRRRPAHPRRDRGVPGAAVGRRQRHHPAHDLARDARADASTPTSGRC